MLNCLHLTLDGRGPLLTPRCVQFNTAVTQYNKTRAGLSKCFPVKSASDHLCSLKEKKPLYFVFILLYLSLYIDQVDSDRQATHHPSASVNQCDVTFPDGFTLPLPSSAGSNIPACGKTSTSILNNNNILPGDVFEKSTNGLTPPLTDNFLSGTSGPGRVLPSNDVSEFTSFTSGKIL